MRKSLALASTTTSEIEGESLRPPTKAPHAEGGSSTGSPEDLFGTHRGSRHSPDVYYENTDRYDLSRILRFSEEEFQG